MFSRPKNWISGGVWKPKNPHSLEHLKYLHSVLCKNQAVTEQNRALLVETLRSISEILIWGDQNDGTVFDFFLEKNMLSFFLRFMRQKYGRFICVQLLQTLNILFENIRNETSVYYLLSNNHVNCIIVHKFDFSDEEVMAYYISFLKTLSLRLNKHTIHFFYNEHTNDFPLYTEAIKFFNHSETMVRIAVRTITLNVYKVLDKSMLRYIRDKTAAPYFSNLVWFIGNNVLDLDLCVRHDTDHNSKDRLSDLVAEHLDHLHYLNDILCLNIDALNEVLTDHLLNNLLLPLYVYSLTKRNKYELRSSEKPHVNPVVSLFLLSQVFLIMRHKPLVRQLADIIFHGDLNIFNPEGQTPSPQLERRIRGFVKPSESLAKTLDKARGKGGKPIRRPNYRNTDEPETDSSHSAGNSTFYGSKTDTIDEGDYYNIEEIDDPERDDDYDSESASTEGAAFYDAISGDPPAEPSSPGPPSLQSTPSKALDSAREQKHSEVSNTVEAHPSESSSEIKDSEGKHSEELAVYQNVTDDEKLMANIAVPGPSEDSPVLTNTDVTPAVIRGPVVTDHGNEEEFTLENRPYLQVVFGGLHSSESDYHTLFSLCLLYALGHNTGINQELLDTILMPTEQSHAKDHYNVMLVESLIHIISRSCQNNSKVRLATLELAIKLLKSLVFKDDQCFLQDGHLAAIEGAREEATLLLRNFYKVWEKSEEIFLDMFEDEFREMKTRPLNVEYLTMDASILLPPTGTPLTGIDFIKRLPCGEVEKARKAIRVFFYVRDLSLTLRREAETDLPLTKQEECVKLGDVLDLNTKMFVFRETNIPYLEYYRVKITKTSKDNSDLIACTVVSSKENKRERRFLVIDVLQLILVEPDSRKLGWGLVKFIGFLQDVEVTGDKEDSRSLHITIHKPSMNVHAKPLPLLSAKFMFDDHIRCMAAKQRLSKGRLKARQRKMQMIAKLLELPAHIVESMYQPPTGSISQSAVALRTSGPGGSSSAIPGRSHQVKIRTKSEVVKKSVFANVDQSSAFASAQDQQSKQSQKDHLPSRSSSGAKSRSSRSSGGQPGVVKRVPGGRSQKKSEQPSPQQMCRGSPDIEQAEEAHPSPEMSASRSDKSSSSGRTIVENVTPAKEVPFEDISKRASKLLSGTRELFQGSLSQLQNESSPKRQRSVSSSEVASGSSTPSSDRSRASSRGSVKGRDRAGSCPSPEPHDQNKSLGDGLQHISSHHQNKNSNNGEEYDSSESPPRVRRSSSKDSTGPCPKTLTPAQAPALSLVKSCDVSMSENMNIPVGDSPMLLPPADPERFCGLREASQSSSSSASVGTSVFSETNLAQSLSEKLEFEDSIRSGDDDSKEISNNSEKEDNFESEGTDEAKSGSKEHHSSSTIAIPKTKLSAFSPNILSKTPPTLEETSTTADLSKIERVTESSESATSQLTKLAQIVSEHYSSFEDDKDSIEMTQNTNVEEKSDRVSEGTVHTHTDSSQENSPVAESRDQ